MLLGGLGLASGLLRFLADPNHAEDHDALPGTALVLCDMTDHETHEPVPHSPRGMLKRQVERAAGMGLTPMMATELEFFLFERSYDDIRRSGFRDLAPLVGYNQDYNLFQSAREEHVMRPIRNHLWDAGVPVENSKGEAETGQEELNIRYADAVACADNHTIAKQAIKEIADEYGDQLSEVFDPISEALTDEEMTRMNEEVSVNLEQPMDVAEQWLTDQGLIGG